MSIESSSEASAPSTPSSRASRVVYIVLFITGIASSLPFSVFTTAQGYFLERFGGTSREATFMTWFTTAFTATALASMVVRTVWIADRMPNPVTTVVSTLFIVLSVLGGHTIATRLPQLDGEWFFRTTMASIVAVACANTMLQDGLVRLVATFPPQYTQGLFTGQGVAGVAAAVANFVIVATNPEPTKNSDVSSTNMRLSGDQDAAAFLFFALGSGIVLASTLAFLMLSQMSTFQRYHKVAASNASRRRRTTPPIVDGAMHQPLLPKQYEVRVSSLDVAYCLRHYAATVIIILSGTMALFPGVTSLLHSLHPSRTRLFRDLFIPASFVLFNTGDLLGRWAAASMPTPRVKILFIVAIARTLLWPLVMLCNLENAQHMPMTTVVFKSDVFPAAFLLMCAFTHGLLTTQAMMRYPTVLKSTAQKQAGGTVMFFMLSVGLTFGSILSFVLLSMLKSA